MSNLTFGGQAAEGAEFASYETLPGGAGASRASDGQSAIQTHMTNTRNTPIEELEQRAPVRVRALSVRRGSGGRGARRGGDGLVKEVEALAPLQGSFLGERQRSGPPGADGGQGGRPGRVFVERAGKRTRLPAKSSFELAPGDAVIVETPGGGGHGAR